MLERLQLYLNEDKVLEAINYPKKDQMNAKDLQRLAREVENRNLIN